ncbi:MAG TPA: hypothetical protein VKE40_00460 [Gemmataceae bacterium]|nr:hypothetical protein [Gemmataceae bacterium]
MSATLPAHRIETTLQEDGRLVVESLPFHAGQSVEVIILPRPGGSRTSSPEPLRGLPVRYDRPFDPVAESEWDASR